MTQQPDPIEGAVRRFWLRHTFWHCERKITVACLIRQADWRPLKVDWWRGKEVYIIGVGTDGNFFLRHCDGTVRYWGYKLQRDEVTAPSVKDFIARLVE
jgi:hypothetical protein